MHRATNMPVIRISCAHHPHHHKAAVSTSSILSGLQTRSPPPLYSASAAHLTRPMPASQVTLLPNSFGTETPAQGYRTTTQFINVRSYHHHITDANCHVQNLPSAFFTFDRGLYCGSTCLPPWSVPNTRPASVQRRFV